MKNLVYISCLNPYAMPIRMIRDRVNTRPDNFPGGGGGGRLPGGFNAGCLAALLPMLFKHPKLLIVILIVGAAFYFLGGQKSCGLMQSSSGGDFALGGMLDERMYDKAEVFEPLADNVSNPLPEKVSLLEFCPERLNQGRQGSCVAWSSAYAARTILLARETGGNPDEIAFSPSFLYNQIGLEDCQGSYIIRAMENMNKVGGLPLSQFPYNENDCSKTPGPSELQAAKAFRTKGFNRLSAGAEDYKTDMLAIKQNLAQGAPVVIGMMVGGSFMQSMVGQKVWIPDASDYSMTGFGGHAMCVIGYDDFLEGGSFLIMNSWGSEWGENGIGWVRYRDFNHFVKEAYGLYPMGSAGVMDESLLKAGIGLSAYDESASSAELPSIPLSYRGQNLYQSAPLKKQSKFKIRVTNSLECYVYIFGEETDGSSYVLFPYTPKHSPYCGITGTRLFPRDYSMSPDSIGSRDYMAVVVTRNPVNYKELNEKISRSRKSTYAARVNEALGERLIEDVRFSNENGMISFETAVKDQQAIALIIEVPKR